MTKLSLPGKIPLLRANFIPTIPRVDNDGLKLIAPRVAPALDPKSL